MAKKKVSIHPTGTPPLWAPELHKEFGMMYFVILERLFQTFQNCRKRWDNSRPTPFIANIRALCCLLREHPLWPRNLRFERRHVSEWCKYVEENLEASKQRIALKYRDEYVNSVRADLDFLTEFMDRKRDKKTDISC